MPLQEPGLTSDNDLATALPLLADPIGRSRKLSARRTGELAHRGPPEPVLGAGSGTLPIASQRRHAYARRNGAAKERMMRQTIRLLVSSILLLVGVGSASAQTADLRVAVTSTSFGVGDEGVYRVSVRNASNTEATQPIRILATLPG